MGYGNSGIYIRSRSPAELQWKIFDKNTIVDLMGILEQKVTKANCLHFLSGMKSLPKEVPGDFRSRRYNNFR